MVSRMEQEQKVTGNGKGNILGNHNKRQRAWHDC